jgi:probable rRNA maturation factor
VRIPAASRTMILVDPDLDPHPPPQRPAFKGVLPLPAPNSRSRAADKLLPSAATLARFLRAAQAEVRLRGHVSVLLTTDAAIRRLNRQFRGIDKPTDVLSFPADTSVQNKETIAGDLAISVPTARRQAAACGHSLAAELKVLMLHGLLHLAGYDHESDSGQMARRERKLRAQLNLPQGLIERTNIRPVHPSEKTQRAARRKRAESSAVAVRPRKSQSGAPSLERFYSDQGGKTGPTVARIAPTAGGARAADAAGGKA